MPHELVFDDDDPILHRLREVALSFPGAKEKVSHGMPAFYTTKVFAWYAMSNKIDGVWVRHPQSVCLLLSEDERLSVLSHPQCWVPGYIGPYGWLGFDLDESTDWGELAEWMDDSYRETAPQRLIAELDARR